MRGLKRFVILSALTLISCKTQRPIVEINEHVNDTTLMSSNQASGMGKLKISKFTFPENGVKYTRIQLELTGGLQPVVRDNYELNEEIPVQVGQKYELKMILFNNGKPIYSNKDCTRSRTFTANSGTNNYIVAVCPYVETSTNLTGPSDVEMIQTPNNPGD